MACAFTSTDHHEKMSAVKKMDENIYEILTNDACDDNMKMQAIQSLKKQFKPPDRIFSRLKLDPLLQRARFSLENKTPDKNFLFSYGTSLVCTIGRYPNLDSEILCQLEYIFTELRKEDSSLTDLLVTKLWNHLKNGSVFDRDVILSVSKQVIERTVLDWVETDGNPQVLFLSEMSADSPILFQTVTLVLYEVLVRTCFHRKVLEVQKLFILTVKSVCLKKGKNFLGLYPKGCRQLVSLLRVPPKVYSQGKQNVMTDVISLLLELFLSSRKTALILLSHYSDWVNIFKLNLQQIEI